MDGIIRIDKVVSELEVWLDASFPFAKFKVKVLERSNGDYLAVPNLARRDRVSGERDGLSGLGDDPEEAVNDLLARFVSNVRENSIGIELSEADFEWSAPEDF